MSPSVYVMLLSWFSSYLRCFFFRFFFLCVCGGVSLSVHHLNAHVPQDLIICLLFFLLCVLVLGDLVHTYNFNYYLLVELQACLFYCFLDFTTWRSYHFPRFTISKGIPSFTLKLVYYLYSLEYHYHSFLVISSSMPPAYSFSRS